MAFDVNAFLNTSYESAFETDYVLVPVGTYIASLKGLPTFKLVDPGDVASSKPGRVYAGVTLRIYDEELAKAFNSKTPGEVTMPASIYFDVAPDNHNVILWGKNQSIDLGKLRDALGQNEPGVPWNPGMLENAGPVVIKVDEAFRRDSEGNVTDRKKNVVTSWGRYTG
jgi:hypothetical protein